MRDHRHAERVGLSAVRGEVLVVQPMFVTQMSRSGMQVETTSPLLLDSVHEFRLTLGEQSIVVRGRVAHARISDVDHDQITYVSGIEFVELSDRVAGAIHEFVAAISRHRESL